MVGRGKEIGECNPGGKVRQVPSSDELLALPQNCQDDFSYLLMHETGAPNCVKIGAPEELHRPEVSYRRLTALGRRDRHHRGDL